MKIRFFREESAETALTVIEKQVQLLRQEFRNQESIHSLHKTINQLEKKLTAETNAKTAAIKDKEAALTRQENSYVNYMYHIHHSH